jgi:uncharacterized DUF497 family protein
MGVSELLRVLVVCHCYRETDEEEDIIRIISARRANDDERASYEEQVKK